MSQLSHLVGLRRENMAYFHSLFLGAQLNQFSRDQTLLLLCKSSNGHHTGHWTRRTNDNFSSLSFEKDKVRGGHRMWSNSTPAGAQGQTRRKRWWEVMDWGPLTEITFQDHHEREDKLQHRTSLISLSDVRAFSKESYANVIALHYVVLVL